MAKKYDINIETGSLNLLGKRCQRNLTPVLLEVGATGLDVLGGNAHQSVYSRNPVLCRTFKGIIRTNAQVSVLLLRVGCDRGRHSYVSELAVSATATAWLEIQRCYSSGSCSRNTML